eukprot:m.123620 g.123620  ORF g.123620 m.123620 type:complete len:392 (+) comp37824_c0_seq3:479-1654(+)
MSTQNESLFASKGRPRLTRGGDTCCIPGCYNSTREDRHLKFHSLPKHPAKRRKWLKLIRRPDSWDPSANQKVCSNHFQGGRKSCSSSYPTIFPFTSKSAVQGRRRRVRLTKETDCADDTISVNSDEGITGCTLPARPVPSLRRLAYHSHLKCLSDAAISAKKIIDDLQSQVATKDVEIDELQYKLARKTLSVENTAFADDSDLFRHYTGLPNYKVFCIFYHRLFEEAAEKMLYVGTCYSEKARTVGVAANSRPGRASILSKKNECFLTLCRLRRGFDERDLAERFDISMATVSRVWRSWLQLMYDRLKQLPIWASKITVQKELPLSFREMYPSTRVILDCTDIFIETPSSTIVQCETYSTYKHHNTAKGLVGVAPHGAVTFIFTTLRGKSF